jgi:hypothetical protein
VGGVTINDPVLLFAARQAIVAEIHREITSTVVPPRPLPLHTFLRALATKFRIAVFTLNYDDVVDRTFPSWFDGFSGERQESAGGHFWEARGFDAKAFDGWRDATEPVLVHLHGSVRFGYLSAPPWRLARFSDAAEAGKTIHRGIRPDDYSSGQIVSTAPIISGLNKLGKLINNPVPFGYYYRAFVDAVLGCERLLVIGYGGRDDHLNTWLEQFAHKHGDAAKAVWIGRLTTDHAMKPTDAMEILQTLAGGRYDRFCHIQDPQGAERLHECGPLRIVASGFPVSATIRKSVLGFLRG